MVKFEGILNKNSDYKFNDNNNKETTLGYVSSIFSRVTSQVPFSPSGNFPFPKGVMQGKLTAVVHTAYSAYI